MRGGGRRHQNPQDRKPPPVTTPTPEWHLSNNRESDASLCSSRPSSSSARSSIPISDHSYQVSALKTINSYLSSHSSHSFPPSPKNLPSAKVITDTLRFVLTRLSYPPSNKLDEDIQILLKQLNCPIKLNKSALKAPGTPHSWPHLLAIIHWLVQLDMCSDCLTNSTQSRSNFENNSMFVYSLNSYLHYIRGDDDSVDEIDREFMGKLQQEKESVEENVSALAENVKALEGESERLRTEPSAREVLEKERSMLEGDVNKFHAMIEQLDGHIVSVEKVLLDKEKELEVKVGERKMILDENEELNKTVGEQAFNARDADRMKRELMAVERDIGEADVARNAWEEKCWDLDANMGHKFKELEALLRDCNQAIRRLKLGNGLQYELNPKGSTPAEVLGIDYKSTLQHALASFADDIKKSSMTKLEEFISLQQTSVENAAKIEEKRNHVVALQSRIDKGELQLDLLKKEAHDYLSRCTTEARKLVEEVEAEAHKLDIVEREATEFLQISNMKLQAAIRQSEEEVQMCACELFALVDSVSKYKEYMASKISDMKNGLLEAVCAVSDMHKGSLSPQFGDGFDASH